VHHPSRARGAPGMHMSGLLPLMRSALQVILIVCIC
jgi:hypothetical protein